MLDSSERRQLTINYAILVAVELFTIFVVAFYKGPAASQIWWWLPVAIALAGIAIAAWGKDISDFGGDVIAMAICIFGVLLATPLTASWPTGIGLIIAGLMSLALGYSVSDGKEFQQGDYDEDDPRYGPPHSHWLLRLMIVTPSMLMGYAYFTSPIAAIIVFAIIKIAFFWVVRMSWAKDPGEQQRTATA